jgi:acyl-CoA thioesterase FadM
MSGPLSANTAVVVLRPRYEGGNIRTWVGFKHILYLAEEAVLHWFRERGWGPRRLYHEHGLGLTVVDASLLLPAVVEIDDAVTARVEATGAGRFAVRLQVERQGRPVTVAKGRVAVALVRERGAPGGEPAPGELAPLVVPGVEAAAAGGTSAPPGPGAFHWSWPARYFHCHFSDRVQHSAYVRALEEIVDRFLAARGLAVGRLLAERGWIPVVSRVRVTLLADAHLGERVDTALTVDDVVKRVAWDARMDCRVERGGTMVPTATARILHGYALARGDGAGRLVELDEATLAAICQEPRT